MAPRMAPRIQPEADKPEFRGFDAAALDFFEGLEADNSRSFWLDSKSTYDEHVRGAMALMLASFPDSYQPFKVFRPNRDVRFSKDKSPYKTVHGAASETDGGSVFYTHLSAAGVFAASGMYSLETDQVARLRSAVADDSTGPEVERIIAAITKKGARVGHGMSEPLKTTPRGFPSDHPRHELLRWKALIASVEITDESVVTSVKVRDQILAFWKLASPLSAWLDRNVGPSTIVRER